MKPWVRVWEGVGGRQVLDTNEANNSLLLWLLLISPCLDVNVSACTSMYLLVSFMLVYVYACSYSQWSGNETGST